MDGAFGSVFSESSEDHFNLQLHSENKMGIFQKRMVLDLPLKTGDPSNINVEDDNDDSDDASDNYDDEDDNDSDSYDEGSYNEGSDNDDDDEGSDSYDDEGSDTDDDEGSDTDDDDDETDTGTTDDDDDDGAIDDDDYDSEIYLDNMMDVFNENFEKAVHSSQYIDWKDTFLSDEIADYFDSSVSVLCY